MEAWKECAKIEQQLKKLFS